MEKKIEYRPWGKFERLTYNEESTVKLIYVNKNSSLSLQFHNNRDEFWKILKGSGMVQINDKVKPVNVEDEILIPRGTLHRISTQEFEIIFLEIATGYFDEKDIVRLEDAYGRF